jgi:ABC-type bacteriocin/lantibiotic exporter with double-glycine peptidase domain
MERVKQKTGTDCGVACVAMVCGKDYDEVKAFIFPHGGRSMRTNKDQLIAALKHFGRKSARNLQSSGQINFTKIDWAFDAILKCNRQENGNWHWIAWDGKQKRMLDPKEPPYKRPRVHSYLRII